MNPSNQKSQNPTFVLCRSTEFMRYCATVPAWPWFRHPSAGRRRCNEYLCGLPLPFVRWFYLLCSPVPLALLPPTSAPGFIPAQAAAFSRGPIFEATASPIPPVSVTAAASSLSHRPEQLHRRIHQYRSSNNRNRTRLGHESIRCERYFAAGSFAKTWHQLCHAVRWQTCPQRHQRNSGWPVRPPDFN
jgi:hypothetical protein